METQSFVKTIMPGASALRGLSPIPSSGKAATRRLDSYGADATAHLDNVEGTIENWKRSSTSERVYALMSMDSETRNYLFSILPPEAKAEFLEEVKRQTEAKRERAIEKASKVAKCFSLYHSLFILLETFAERYWRKTEELCEEVGIVKRFPFKMKRPYTTAREMKKKTYKMCLDLEGGGLMQMMTQHLQHWWREYDNVGIFVSVVQREALKQDGLMRKMGEIEAMCRKVAEKRAPEGMEDIVTYALMADFTAQLVSRSLNEGNKAIRIALDESFRKMCHDRAVSEGKAKGKFQERKLPEPTASHNFASCMEEMVFVILGKNGIGAGLVPEMKAIGDKAVEMYNTLFNEDSFDYEVGICLKDAIDYTIRDYIRWYFAKMVLVVKEGEQMPEGVKDDIRIIMNSNFGYCRVMNDVHTCAKRIKTRTHDDKGEKVDDCVRDAMDEIDELVSEGVCLHTFDKLVERVFLVKERGLEAERYLKKHFENVYKEACVKNGKGN